VTSIAVEGLGKRYVLGVPKSASWWPARRGIGRGSGEKPRTPRELWALRGVSFSLEAGTILGIVGPNGAGKTTLLKILARVTPPSEGRVRGRGRVLPLLQIRGGLNPYLTGRENVLLNAAMYGVTRREAERCLDAIVDFAGLGEHIDAPLRAYSNGMHVRLAFSIALNLRPRILLADELLQVGDAEFQERCLDGVRAAARSGTTVLFVSHDLPAVSRLCDRGLWLEEGTVAAEGGAAEVVEAYASGSPSWAPARAKSTPSARTRAKESRTAADAGALGEILAVRLLAQDGREVESVNAEDRVGIRISFRIDRADLAALCGVVVRSEGVVAFRSFQPNATCLPAGLHDAEAWIPAGLLAARTYTVRVQLRLGEDAGGAASGAWKERSRFVFDPALTFQVHDRRSRGAIVEKRPGIVGPALDWSVRRGPDARGT
jgi:lipopolysaccharide transport system ATP-binding protein